MSTPEPHEAGHLVTTQRSPRCDLAALRQQVQQARNDYDEAANDHGDMTGHGAQEERAWGAVQALDEVLGMLAEVQRQEQLAAGDKVSGARKRAAEAWHQFLLSAVSEGAGHHDVFAWAYMAGWAHGKWPAIADIVPPPDLAGTPPAGEADQS